MFLAAALTFASPANCTAEKAVKTTVEEMAREPTAWFDRCVRLDGFVNGYTFYSDAKGFYRRYATDQDDHSNDGWLGLYFENREEISKPFGKVSLIGTVDDCQRSYESATAKSDPHTIIMMIGYCHYQSGLTLKRVNVLSRTPARIPRQKGDAARRAFGDLEVPDRSHEIPTEAQVLLREFQDAFAADDGSRLMTLVYPYRSNLNDEAAKKTYEAFVSGAVGPLRVFRARGRLGNATWFYARESHQEHTYGPSWFACFCRNGHCEGQWPIADLDTGASSNLPYVCLRIFKDPADHGLRLALDAVERPFGIADR